MSEHLRLYHSRASVAKKQRPEENWASKVLTAALQGAIVTLNDDGSSPGMYDLRIEYDDGRVGAAEVTAAAHPDALALWRLISAERWIEPTLEGGWAVCLTPTANYKRLKARLPMLLLQLEWSGTTELHVSAVRDCSITRFASELGIVSAYQGGTAHPGSIYPTIELPHDQMGGFVSETGDPLAIWLSDWISDSRRADNLKKLGNSGVDERHLVVIVAGFGNVPFHVTDILMRDDAPLPTILLSVPSEISHIWTMSTLPRAVGIRWSRSGQWERFDKLIDTWFASP
jgi:hypothetical protein